MGCTNFHGESIGVSCKTDSRDAYSRYLQRRKTSSLTITSNDPDNPAVTVVLQGQGLINFAFHQNYPNPFNPTAAFNPTATIRFDLPEASQVSLIVYDVLGREIANLVERDMEPGIHSIIWNAKDKAGRNLPSGLYIARIVTPIYTRSIKMVLLK